MLKYCFDQVIAPTISKTFRRETELSFSQTWSGLLLNLKPSCPTEMVPWYNKKIFSSMSIHHILSILLRIPLAVPYVMVSTFYNPLLLMTSSQSRCQSTLGSISSAIIGNLRVSFTSGKERRVLPSDPSFLQLSWFSMATPKKCRHNTLLPHSYLLLLFFMTFTTPHILIHIHIHTPT